MNTRPTLVNKCKMHKTALSTLGSVAPSRALEFVRTVHPLLMTPVLLPLQPCQPPAAALRLPVRGSGEIPRGRGAVPCPSLAWFISPSAASSQLTCVVAPGVRRRVALPGVCTDADTDVLYDRRHARPSHTGGDGDHVSYPVAVDGNEERRAGGMLESAGTRRHLKTHS